VFAVWFVVGVCTHATDSTASAAASDMDESMRIFILCASFGTEWKLTK
jgi:hypothetical protein